MANLITVRLNRVDAGSWGFRLQGGKDFGTPLIIQRITGGTPADRAGLIAGDTVLKINNTDVYNLRHKDAQDVILRAGPSFEITVQRGGSTWKPQVTPVGSIPAPRAAPISNVSPVTATSLAAGRQESIGAIGTSHNVSAKPFSAEVNGGPRLVNKQYNSPLPLYSEASIAETLSAQTEVLSNGVLGVNFKKNEKSYDASNSAVFRMVQEADKEPRDYEPEPFSVTGSGVATAPLAVPGLRHVYAPENRPAPASPQLPPGQNICADCERLIVGVFVRIKDKNLHVECFKCATCGTSLKNVGYYNLNNKLYCDVHAKLAAINNRPAPNLVPVTVPPGGKIPSGTISAALSSHSLPSPSPLSPNAGYSAAPYQPGGSLFSPRPFSSVAAPLSPSSTLPKLSPTSSPSTPLTDNLAQKTFAWPPAQAKELPTASPLYFPPPSQIEPLIKRRQEEEHEESSSCQESCDNMEYYSSKYISTNETRSSTECSKTLESTLDAQMLVESIMETKKKEPDPSHPPDVSVTFTISESQFKQRQVDSAAKLSAEVKTVDVMSHSESQFEEKVSSSLERTSAGVDTALVDSKACLLKDAKQQPCLASMYEKKMKVENSVPHQWESPMLIALKTASDKAYHIDEESKIDTLSQIPIKPSSSPFASALATAPAEPFTPVNTNIKPVALPQLTTPYFPPEHPILTTEQILEKVTNKKLKDDPFFKDLPQPTEKINLRTALTTASDRPYSPFGVDVATYESKSSDVQEIKIQDLKKSSAAEKTSLVSQSSKATQKAKTSQVKEIQATSAAQKSSTQSSRAEVQTVAKESKQRSKSEVSNSKTDKNLSESVLSSVVTEKDVTFTGGTPPLIQCVRSTFETKTDKVQLEMTCQFSGDVGHITKTTTKKAKEATSQQKSQKQTSSEKTQKSESETRSEVNKKSLSESQKDKSIYESSLLQERTNVDSLNESEQFRTKCSTQQSESLRNLDECNRQSIQRQAIQEFPHSVPVPAPKPSLKPVQQVQHGQHLNIPQISFQPVNDYTPEISRSRNVTPSMINKRAPLIPAYQSRLVATEQGVPEINFYDPGSPSVSRSASPYSERPTSPFPSGIGRAPSPAPGPPPNPLKVHSSPETLIREGRKESAVGHIKNFIPQHQSKSLQICKDDKVATLKRLHQMQTVECETLQKTQQKTAYLQERQGAMETKCIKSGTINLNPQVQSVSAASTQAVSDTSKLSVNKASSATQSSASASVATTNVGVSKSYKSQPNTGLGGGRQAGAIGVAPRRGRGTLNLGGAPGSRVPLCAHCHSNIRGPFITALGKIWCPEHFVCATPSCRRALQDLGFVEEQGQLYCEYCFEQYLAPPCSKCAAKVKGDCLKAIGKNFHPECFNCVYCGKLFGNSPFFLEDGQPYCENDWNELFTTKCFACGFPVEAGDRWVEALSNNYHSQCFNCTMCKKNLEGQSFFAKGGRPFCKNHAR